MAASRMIGSSTASSSGFQISSSNQVSSQSSAFTTGSPMDPIETPDPVEALAQVWPWLELGGDHFTGVYRVDTNENQSIIHLQLRQKPPSDAVKYVNGFIRQFLKRCGWRALDVQYKKSEMVFTMRPWPLHKQEADRLRSEDFRREARRRREEIQKDPEGSCTPEP